MRTAALPTFRKLYGRIETDIMASDEITVVIQNNYNTYSFGGTKAVVLSTASWIGGKNNFIGVAYVAVGGICLLLAMGFVVLYVVKPRALGDPAYLSWNKEAAEYSH
uniref:ALA-interacting subunit n=5 Tax=Triticinae TaxID=1648030 RepID=A0A452ZMH0_AEGTS